MKGDDIFVCRHIVINKSDPFDNSVLSQQQAFLSLDLSHVIFKLSDSSENMKNIVPF